MQELGFEHYLILHRYVLDKHWCYIAAEFGVFVDRDLASFLRNTGYLNFIKYHINPVLLLIQARALLLSSGRHMTLSRFYLLRNFDTEANKLYD